MWSITFHKVDMFFLHFACVSNENMRNQTTLLIRLNIKIGKWRLTDAADRSVDLSIRTFSWESRCSLSNRGLLHGDESSKEASSDEDTLKQVEHILKYDF